MGFDWDVINRDIYHGSNRGSGLYCGCAALGKPWIRDDYWDWLSSGVEVLPMIAIVGTMFLGTIIVGGIWGVLHLLGDYLKRCPNYVDVGLPTIAYGAAVLLYLAAAALFVYLAGYLALAALK